MSIAVTYEPRQALLRIGILGIQKLVNAGIKTYVGILRPVGIIELGFMARIKNNAKAIVTRQVSWRTGNRKLQVLLKKAKEVPIAIEGRAKAAAAGIGFGIGATNDKTEPVGGINEQ